MWPVGRGIRRYGLSDYLFAKSPWAVVQGAIETRTPRGRQAEALAFLEQARGFFDAAHDRTVASTPLILYYAFLNLAKALVLASGHTGSLGRAMHGLKDEPGQTGQEITGASVVVKTAGNDPSVFPLYAAALGVPAPANNDTFAVTELMAQVVVGHRLWREVGKKERFVALDGIRFYHDTPTGPGNVWLRLYIQRGDLSRFGITHKRALAESALTGTFDWVKSEADDVLCLEQLAPVAYSHRAADVIKDVVETARPHLWRSATSMPPYRHYYVHLSPPPRQQERLPQLLSL